MLRLWVPFHEALNVGHVFMEVNMNSFVGTWKFFFFKQRQYSCYLDMKYIYTRNFVRYQCYEITWNFVFVMKKNCVYFRSHVDILYIESILSLVKNVKTILCFVWSHPRIYLWRSKLWRVFHSSVHQRYQLWTQTIYYICLTNHAFYMQFHQISSHANRTINDIFAVELTYIRAVLPDYYITNCKTLMCSHKFAITCATSSQEETKCSGFMS
jgi:hypothetical protein